MANFIEGKSARKRKRLYVRAERVIAIGAMLLLSACSINIQIKKNTTMTNKKKNVTSTTPQFNTPFKIHGATGEQNDGKSLTVQGEAYTIQELIKRHVNGLMPPIGLTPLYDHDEPTHDDYVGMRKPDFDLTDIDEIKSKVKDANEKLSNAQKKKQAQHSDRTSVAKEQGSKTSNVVESSEPAPKH